MKSVFKLKITEQTTIQDIENEIDKLYKNKQIKEIPLNYLVKIIEYLGAEQIQATGSSVRFRHELLVEHSAYYNGIFQIHKIHKGGNQDYVLHRNFKKYLYPALKQIIALKLNQNENRK